jgi:outer membrane protein OmpA-like peptidoglycan-associated protein
MRNPIKSVLLSVAAIPLIVLPLYSAARKGSTDTVTVTPPTTLMATRGLTQTASAEPLGAGRLTFNLTGTWYRQALAFPGVPVKDADIATGIAAFSFGVNSFIDVFASVAGYGLLTDKSDFGAGSVTGGLQGSLPLPGASPLRLGAQLAIIGGTSTNQIDRNNSDGYDYFETRTGYDFMGKIIETVSFGNDSLGIKIHFNQGADMSLQSEHPKLLLIGAGIQGTVHPMIVIGLEVNSRTGLSTMNVRTDPLWLTPSIFFRTPYYFNVLAGIDVSLSNERPNTDVRAIEPYRIFGGLSFSFDLLAGKRRAAREKAAQEAAERATMVRKAREAQARAVLLARKAHQDSLAMIKAREAETRRADSMAQKIRADSIALEEANRKLAEERSKRSDAEKQLLSTGLLLLDAVYFESGKAEISINSFPYLNIIGKMLTKYQKLQVEVSGHTDNIGKYDNNMNLSQARSEAVRRYLIQVAPELLSRISARGYGQTQPKAPNTTAEGRKMNRRVELQVLNKEVLREYN